METRRSLIHQIKLMLEKKVFQILNPRIRHLTHPIMAELDQEACPVRFITWDSRP